jgi:hypothetical protein
VEDLGKVVEDQRKNVLVFVSENDLKFVEIPNFRAFAWIAIAQPGKLETEISK